MKPDEEKQKIKELEETFKKRFYKCPETGKLKSVFFTDPKDDRRHISYGHSGPAWIYYKPHNTDASSIEGHLDDIGTLLDNHRDLQKPWLLLEVDGGFDYALGSGGTELALGIFFKERKLDGLILVTNAPGDSKFNPGINLAFGCVISAVKCSISVEHLWGTTSKWHAGHVLPKSYPECEERGMSKEETEEYVLNKAVKQLVRIDEGLKYGGFNVAPVAGYCHAEEVEVNGEFLDNRSFPTEKYHDWKTLAKSYLSKRSIRGKKELGGKEFLKFSSWAMKPIDRTTYSFVIRCKN